MASKITKTLLATGFALLGSSVFAAPIQWATNGHWYDYIDTALTPQDAFTAAASSTFMGMGGYLATVTSAGENMFVSSTVAGGALAWLGGSDDGAAVNDWTWRAGPEAGSAFTFTAWMPGEPNDCCGGENWVHTNWASLGGWNDHGGPGNPGQVNGYIIEYSERIAETPEPAVLGMMLTGLGLLGAARRRKAA